MSLHIRRFKGNATRGKSQILVSNFSNYIFSVSPGKLHQQEMKGKITMSDPGSELSLHEFCELSSWPQQLALVWEMRRWKDSKNGWTLNSITYSWDSQFLLLSTPKATVKYKQKKKGKKKKKQRRIFLGVLSWLCLWLPGIKNWFDHSSVSGTSLSSWHRLISSSSHQQFQYLSIHLQLH